MTGYSLLKGTLTVMAIFMPQTTLTELMSSSGDVLALVADGVRNSKLRVNEQTGGERVKGVLSHPLFNRVPSNAHAVTNVLGHGVGIVGGPVDGDQGWISMAFNVLDEPVHAVSYRKC